MRVNLILLGIAAAMPVFTQDLRCIAQSAGTPSIRAEGAAELTGDIILSCGGGTPTPRNDSVDSSAIAFEIAARHLHYRSEGVSLIWVFSELTEKLPQGFRDVVRFQRGSAFLFDAAAHAASDESRSAKIAPQAQT